MIEHLLLELLEQFAQRLGIGGNLHCSVFSTSLTAGPLGRTRRHPCTLHDVGDLPHLDSVDRVLFRTFESFPHDRWDSSFTAIEAEAIEWLALQGVKLIGTDAPSVDPQESKTMDAHKAVLGHDIRILEGLVLDDVPEGRYELIALPLKIAGGDAGLCRAILRELER